MVSRGSQSSRIQECNGHGGWSWSNIRICFCSPHAAFTGSAWWHCQTGVEGEKNMHKQADTDWFSCVVMQSSTNSSVLSRPCKYLTDSYNSSLASAPHLNLFKSWLCQNDNSELQRKHAAGGLSATEPYFWHFCGKGLYVQSSHLGQLIYCLW